MSDDRKDGPMGEVIQIDEARIRDHLVEMVRGTVEDITEALWGTRVSPGTVSNLNKKIYAKIEEWRHRQIEGDPPYLYLDGIVMKRTWAGEVRNVSLLVASAVNAEGYREILGICEGAKEDKSGWSGFLRHLVDRGLSGVELIISDAWPGAGGEHRGVSAGRPLATVHGALLPQRVQPCPVNQGAGDQPQTQGYSRSGEPRSGADQGRCRGRGVAR